MGASEQVEQTSSGATVRVPVVVIISLVAFLLGFAPAQLEDRKPRTVKVEMGNAIDILQRMTTLEVLVQQSIDLQVKDDAEFQSLEQRVRELEQRISGIK